MKKKHQAFVGTLVTAIGVGLVYVSFFDYFAVRADVAVGSQGKTLLMLALMILGFFLLLIGIIALIFVFSSSTEG